MYNLSDSCKDMANRILINLSETAEGRSLINDTECLAEAANTLLKMSALEEEEDKTLRIPNRYNDKHLRCFLQCHDSQTCTNKR